MPLNCNDIDMTSSLISPRPMAEATESSMSILRAESTRIFNRVFIDPDVQPPYEYIRTIEADVIALTKRFPWFIELGSESEERSGFLESLPKTLASLPWQCHLVQSYLCVQRIRLYRPFLNDQSVPACQASVDAAIAAFAIYRTIRTQRPDGQATVRHRFSMQAYQLFSTAITSLLLLVKERPANKSATAIAAEVEMVIGDLEYLEKRHISIPLALHGAQILRHIMDVHRSTISDKDLIHISFMPSVYSVIGGKKRTREYLERSNSQKQATTASRNVGRVASESWQAIPDSPRLEFSVDDVVVPGFDNLDYPMSLQFWEQWNF